MNSESANIKETETASVYGGDVIRTLLFTTPGETGFHIVRLAVATMQPGSGGKLHFHPDTAERYYILDGHGQLQLDGRTIDLRPGSCAEIPIGQKHVLRSVGIKPLVYIAFHIAAHTFFGAVEHIEQS